MNLIAKQWKSHSEFSRFNQIDIEKIKTFDNSMPIKEEDADVVRIYFNNVVLRDIFINNYLIIKGGYANEENQHFTQFQKFLLSGPEMTDEQFNYIQEKRKHFNEWK